MNPLMDRLCDGCQRDQDIVFTFAQKITAMEVEAGSEAYKLQKCLILLEITADRMTSKELKKFTALARRCGYEREMLRARIKSDNDWEVIRRRQNKEDNARRKALRDKFPWIKAANL